ncbi:MAG: hypothetical protein AB8B70_05535, partial [Prochlorococcus sp.]
KPKPKAVGTHAEDSTSYQRWFSARHKHPTDQKSTLVTKRTAINAYIFSSIGEGKGSPITKGESLINSLTKVSAAEANSRANYNLASHSLASEISTAEIP